MVVYGLESRMIYSISDQDDKMLFNSIIWDSINIIISSKRASAMANLLEISTKNKKYIVYEKEDYFIFV